MEYKYTFDATAFLQCNQTPQQVYRRYLSMCYHGEPGRK